MNSRERVFATLDHKPPDRVPIAEMWIDPKIARSILPGASSSNDLAEYLDLDMVTVATMIYDHDEVEWVDQERGIFRDKWGALQHLTQEAVPVPTPPARIESLEDLFRYTPPDPARSPVLAKVRKLKQRYPDKAVAVVGESGWAPAVFMRGGIEHLLLDFGMRPSFAKDLMAIGAAYYAELFPLAIAAGADVVFLGDDYCDTKGPMMSPKMFRELILPNDAAVDDMTMTIGERVIKGEIKRREEARQIYEAAKNAGQSAALLDQERPNIFTQQVANIAPNAKVSDCGERGQGRAPASSS